MNDEVNITKNPDQNTNDGLPVEMEHQKDLNKLPPSDETNHVTDSEIDQNAGLAVETTTDNTPVQTIPPLR